MRIAPSVLAAVVMATLVSLTAPVLAQTEGAAGEPAAAPAPAPAEAAPPLTREQIIAAIGSDKKLEADLVIQLKARHALELNEITRSRHDQDSRQIALNKEHVVLAYGALWLLAVGFLVLLWLRQQTLNARISQLQKELEAAIAGGAK